MARITIANAGGPNICAFLDMLAWSEIGEKLLAASDDGYNVLVGSTARAPILFNNGYREHPNVYNAKFNSTAAGRYEFIHKTWAVLQARLKLPAFNPVCQDLACIELLRENGAIPHIEAGNLFNAVEIAAAIRVDAQTWASLPGGDSGQPQRSLLDLERAYGAALAKYVNLKDALGVFRA